jgi:hypothetical protein
MIQEADNMDKGLRTVLGFKLSAQGNAPAPQQPPQQPPSMGSTPSFAQPAPPPAPSVTAGGSRPPPTTSFQPGHRKKQSQPQAPGVSTPIPSPAPTVSTPTLQAAMPAPSPQAPKSPKGKVATKSKPPARRKVSTKTNSPADLVAGSSTNPSPESTSDQDHPQTGHAGPSPQISNVKTEDYELQDELLRPGIWKEISGGDTMFHQAPGLSPGWKWEGHIDTPESSLGAYLLIDKAS